MRPIANHTSSRFARLPRPAPALLRAICNSSIQAYCNAVAIAELATLPTFSMLPIGQLIVSIVMISKVTFTSATISLLKPDSGVSRVVECAAGAV